MKNFLILTFAVLLAAPVFAGSTPKNWNFEVNEEGDCSVMKTVKTDKDAAAAIKAIKVAVNKQSFEKKEIVSSTDDGIVYKFKRNTQNRYNPFAGNFRESLVFNLEAKIVGDAVQIKAYEMMIESVYSGYGQREETFNIANKIEEYEAAMDKVNNGKGKEKKDAKDTIDDINESLNMCQEELDKVLNAIYSAL